MSNALAVVNATEWQAMMQMSEVLVRSGFLPDSIKTSQQAVAIILAGRELGIGPWQAIQGINIIKGRPTVSPQLMLALIEQSKLLEDISITGDAKSCTVMMKRRGRSPHTFTFTMEDAKALGLADKSNYRTQPKVMLQWRAIGACSRIVFPDVIMKLYTPDEMGADVTITEDGGMEVVNTETGEIVEAAPVVDAAPPPFGEDKARITAFVARMSDAYGVTAPEIVKALGVTRFGEYAGSEDDAERAVAAWVKPEAAAPAAQPVAKAKPNGKAADAKAPDWTPELAQAWANMLKWAADEFDMNEEAVLLTLNDVQPPVLSKKDWRGTTMQARGAVLAGFCEYDAERIDAWCDKAEAKDELRGRAKDMAEAYKLAAVEVR
jgi:hypothetical protein